MTIHSFKGQADLLSLPAGLQGRRIDASGCPNLAEVGAGLSCYELNLSGAAIVALPDDIRVALRLNLTDCLRLRVLPDGLTVGTLILNGCVALETLPRGLSVSFLDMAGCSALRALPDDLTGLVGRLNVRDCPRLRAIPAGIGPVAQLDVSGCLNLTSLPDALEVTSWIDVAGSGLSGLPDGLKHVDIRWRGVPIDARIAFQPETLSADEILNEANAEIRRVMLDRYGLDRFVQAGRAKELDRDRDAGGVRRLLRIDMPDDEDIVCVSVICPSTGHNFVLRVPPAMQTCRQAVAWTAGFDDPDAYQPLRET